jgi:hypothetical protein
MKVKFVSGPKTGTIEHLQPSIANVLIASGMAEHIPYKNYAERLCEVNAQPSLPDATVRWSVAAGIKTGKPCISARCSRPNCTTLIYDGPPTTLESLTFCHTCGELSIEMIPAAVCKQYRSTYHKPTNLSDDQAKCFEVARSLNAVDTPIQPFGPADDKLRDAAKYSNVGLGHYKPSVDVPYKTAGEILKENLKRGDK